MKNFKLLFILLLAIGTTTCRDAEIQPKDYPIVFTVDATNIDTSGVTLKAVVKNLGTQAITDYGFIVTGGGPQNEISLKTGLKTLSFETRVQSDLDSGEVYNYKAYIRTEQNLVLGNDIEFISKGSGSVVINDMTPKEGFGNEKIRITGQNFSRNANNIKVFLNSQAATIVSSDASYIEFILPTNTKPGEYGVKVIMGKRTLQVPHKLKIVETIIQSVLPLSGTPGVEITISGENLLRGGTVTIDFGGLNAPVTYLTETLIKVKVPLYREYLLLDILADVTVRIGNSKIVYNKKFILKKTWETKKPPLDAFNYQDAFTYQNQVYMHAIYQGYMYRYNPNSDIWAMINNSSLITNIYTGNLYIPINNQLFMVGGVTDGIPQKSLYCYHFDTNTWSQKSNLPFSFLRASYFMLNNKVYILTLEKQLWQCNFENNSYQRLKDFPELPTDEFISTFTANGQVYAVQYGKIWQYDSVNDTWVYKSFNHFSKDYISNSSSPICISYNNTGYILEYGQFLYKFDYHTNKLNLVTLYPGVRGESSKKTLFVIDNKLYVAAIGGRYDSFPFMYAFQDY